MKTDARINAILADAERRFAATLTDHKRAVEDSLAYKAVEVLSRLRAALIAPEPGPSMQGKPPVYSAVHTMKVHPSGSPEAVSSIEIRTTGCNTFHAHSQDEPRVLQGGKRYAVVLSMYELDGGDL